MRLLKVSALAVSLALATGPTIAAPPAELPSFVMTAVSGESWTHQNLLDSELSVMVFFSTGCKPCIGALQQLAAARAQGVTAVAVGKQSPAELKAFAAEHGLTLPVLHADKGLLKKFDAQFVFPTVYVIGPEGRVLDRVQGGGAAVDQMLLALADRYMQRKDYAAAAKLYDGVEGSEQRGVAQVGKGYSLAKAGHLDEAERVFKEAASAADPNLAARGKEGLAEVYLEKGDVEAATAEAKAALAEAPERVGANLTLGKALYRQGKADAAATVVAKAAASGSADFRWQKAEAHYAEGNLNRELKKSDVALVSYTKAAEENPYYAEAMSNQGVVLMEDLKQPEKALAVLKKAGRAAPDDRLAHALIRQAQAAIAQQADLERRKYIDGLVGDLLKQYEKQKAAAAKKPVDDWTSPPMAVSVLGFQTEKGGLLMGRLGLEGVLQELVIQELQAKDVNVVDRAVIDKVLEELKLGASELTDPDTQLRLGRIMAARLIAAGSLFQSGNGGLASMRLIDTETTKVMGSYSAKLAAQDPEQVAKGYAEQTKKTLDDKYPLRGRVALDEGEVVIINLGSKHGARPGMVFNVIKEGKPIELNGRILGYRKEVVGKIEVAETDELMSQMKVLERKGSWEPNQKVILTGS